MSIKAIQVTKMYGEQAALSKVSFDIPPGEIVGFLGPNGAGKSTMMKILTGFIPLTTGRVTICDMDVAEEPTAIKQKIGYLPENNPLYLDMYIREYLTFIAGLHKLKNKSVQVESMINKVGLASEKGKKIGALSKGYRQRVGLAQALIHNPDVLILDEPTSGLDPNQIIEIRELISDIGQEKTVMLSTHIMQEVEAICDRVIIINNGKIVADDSAGSLLKNAGTGSIILVEFDKEIDEMTLKEVNGILKTERIQGYTWHIFTEAKTDIRKAIFDFAVQQGAAVLTIKQKQQRLEDIFKHLTADQL